MFTTNQTAGPSRSNDGFAVIFQTALSEYETVTGKSLSIHPLATQLNSCDSPQAVSTVLQSQAQAFTKFRKNDEKLMERLNPIVHILFTFSATLGEGVGLVSICFGSGLLVYDILLSAIFTSENHLYRDWCTSCRRSLSCVPLAHSSNIQTHRQQGMLSRTITNSSTSSNVSISSSIV
jgi:hypothetical protein